MVSTWSLVPLDAPNSTGKGACWLACATGGVRPDVSNATTESSTSLPHLRCALALVTVLDPRLFLSLKAEAWGISISAGPIPAPASKCVSVLWVFCSGIEIPAGLIDSAASDSGAVDLRNSGTQYPPAADRPTTSVPTMTQIEPPQGKGCINHA